MRRQIVLVICIAIALSLIAFGQIQARKAISSTFMAANAGAALKPWSVDYIEFDDDDTGAYASLAFNTSTDRPSIAYYDATDNALRLAARVTSGGNCGPGNSWNCQTVVITDATYISLDIYPGNPHIFHSGKIGIAYYNPSTGSLNFAENSCAILCEWSFSTIERGVTSPPLSSTKGQYASFKYDLDGHGHIAYYLWSQMFPEDLRYAAYTGSGGNCGPHNYWECQTVDHGLEVGKYASLDVNYEGAVSIAYYDGGNGNLKYAFFGGIGDCYNNNGWICSTVDGGDGSDVGYYASLSAPKSATDTTRIAYYDKTHGKLKYVFLDAAGQCGATNGWWCGDVDDMGTSLTPMGISLKMDKDGYPMIAYQNVPADPGHSRLRIARPYFAYDDQFGNCGDSPPGYLFIYWRCSTIDNAAAETNEANFVSLGFNSSGLATIAYYEDDNYNNPNLKIAYQNWLTFVPYTAKDGSSQ